MTRWFVLLALTAGVAGCAASGNYAPVADVSVYEAVPASGIYHVRQNDTLYSIAWRYGTDYRVLANNNRILPPYSIQAGQVIYLNGKRPDTAPRIVVAKPVARPVVTKASSVKITGEPNYAVNDWVWPTHGKIIAVYSNKTKGIDIGGQSGQAVVAAAPGKVVYAGDGLRGYGNLIILKHNSQYLSAYAYNRHLFVNEGDWVKQGQKIAEMGKDSASRTSLHFEIRKAGKPVNPLNLLNK